MTVIERDNDVLNGVRQTIKALAQALEAGNVAVASRCWSTPALIIRDSGVSALASKSDVDAHCKTMIEQFRLRGPGAMHLRIEQIEQLGQNLAFAEVVWSTPDGSLREVSRYGVVSGSSGGALLCLGMPGPAPVDGNGATKPTLTGALEGTFPASDPASHAVATTAGAPNSRHSTKRRSLIV